MSSSSPHHIVGVDRFNNAVVVLFADGTSFLFPAEFLYAHRNDPGNERLRDEPSDLNGSQS